MAGQPFFTVKPRIADIKLPGWLCHIQIQIKPLYKCLLPCPRRKLYIQLLKCLSLILGYNASSSCRLWNNPIVYACKNMTFMLVRRVLSISPMVTVSYPGGMTATSAASSPASSICVNSSVSMHSSPSTATYFQRAA